MVIFLLRVIKVVYVKILRFCSAKAINILTCKDKKNYSTSLIFLIFLLIIIILRLLSVLCASIVERQVLRWAIAILTMTYRDPIFFLLSRCVFVG